MHNMPGIPEGHFALRPGPFTAAQDLIEIVVHGKGGHGGLAPHKAIEEYSLLPRSSVRSNQLWPATLTR